MIKNKIDYLSMSYAISCFFATYFCKQWHNNKKCFAF